MLQLSKEDIEAIADAVAARARHAEGAQLSGAPYKSWIERGAEFEAATTPEKLSGAPDPSVEEITRIVRDADQDFEGSGGSTRHWVRDCFLPALEKSGLRIVGAPAPASAQGVAVALAFNDWTRDGTSIYATDQGIELSMGNFHSGTVFRGSLAIDIDDATELRRAIESGALPTFLLFEVNTPPSSEKTGEERK